MPPFLSPPFDHRSKPRHPRLDRRRIGGPSPVPYLRYLSEVIADGPVAYYRLEETSGTVLADSSGNARDATKTGVPVLGKTGALADPGNAVGNFTNSDYITVPNSVSFATGSPITIEFWINAAAAAVSEAFTIGASDTPNRCQAHVPYSDGILYWDYGNISLNGRLSISYGAFTGWKHIVLVADTNFMAIYINGQLATSKASWTPPTGTITGGRIGRGIAAPSTSDLDEFAIYNYALSPTRIAAHYKTGQTLFVKSLKWDVPTPVLGETTYASDILSDSPALYWRLGETSGATAADASGHGRTGTYSGVTLDQPSLITSPNRAVDLNGGSVASTYNPWGSTSTIEGWFTRESTGTIRVLWRTTTINEFGLEDKNDAGGNDVRLAGATSTTWTGALSGVSQGATFHCALTYNPATGAAELFINGTSKGVQSITPVTPTGNIQLGGSSFGDGGQTGLADEFAVYVGALSAARIAAHVTSGSATPNEGAALSLKWDMPTPVDATSRALLWDMIAQVNSTSRTLLWDMIAQVNSTTRSLLWDLRSAVDSTVRILLWDMVAQVNATSRTLLWDMIAQVSKAETLKWDLVAQINSTTRTLLWDMTAQVNSTTRTLLWDLIAQVAQIETLKWDLIAQVNSTPRTLLWDLISPVNSNVEILKWDVLTSINAAARTLLWDTRAERASSLTAKWDLLAAVAQSRALLWDLIAQTNGIPQTLKWDLLAAIDANTRALVWNLFGQTGAASRVFVWDTRAETESQLTLVWELISLINPINADALSLVWDIANPDYIFAISDQVLVFVKANDRPVIEAVTKDEELVMA